MKRLLLIVLAAALCLVPLAGSTPAVAQSGNMWTAEYFNNPNWSGAPVLVQSIPLVWFNWGYGSPGAGVPVDNFTARFTTNAFFYAGTYRVTITADDEVTFTVGGVTYLDTRNAGKSGKTITVDIPIFSQGNLPVQVLYREFTQLAYVYVNWQFLSGANPPPPPPPTPTPPNNCTPRSATSVQTQFGNYTPCIQQNIHQKNCFQSDGAWNSPNMGSIEMEPQIEIWGNCTPDSQTSFPVSCDPNIPQQAYKCSKTGAGWFRM